MKKPAIGSWRRILPSFSASGWAYASATVILALLLVAMAASLPMIKRSSAERALEHGQRVVLHTDPQAAAVNAPEAAPPDDAAPPPEEAAPAPETPAPAPAAEPAQPKAAAPADKTPRVIIVLTGVGLSRTSTDAVHALPKEITVAVTPYSSLLDGLLDRYRQDGREYLAEVPMEPADYPVTDPGPHALMSTYELVENLSHLEWALSRVKGAGAVAAPLAEKFTASGAAVQQILEKLSSDRMPFLATRPEAAAALGKLAKDEPDLLIRISDAVIDQRIDPAAIEESLRALETQAKKNGVAVGIGRPYPVTVQALKQWAPGLTSRGVALAPFSATLPASAPVHGRIP